MSLGCFVSLTAAGPHMSQCSHMEGWPSISDSCGQDLEHSVKYKEDGNLTPGGSQQQGQDQAAEQHQQLAQQELVKLQEAVRGPKETAGGLQGVRQGLSQPQ